MDTAESLFGRLEQLNDVGSALSQEKNLEGLLEKILIAAKTITRADGGSLYLTEKDRLRFAIVRTDSLGIAMGGTTGVEVPFYPIHLHSEGGEVNDKMVVAYAAVTGKTVNIADAYTEAGFDFSGTRNFDKKTGYRSQSFLTVPMKNHQGETIGVLQLINRLLPESNDIAPFSEADQRLAESLSSQAAIAITNRQLIDQLESLFESFINLINTAIDDKSPYTGGHCQRVPELTMMLAEAVSESGTGPLGEFSMSDKDRYELKIAGMLHDCGKITTPVHVVDKSTKLETIIDRIGMVDTRFEVIKRDAQIAALEEKLKLTVQSGVDDVTRKERFHQIEQELRETIRRCDEDREFLRHSNVGGEAMSKEAVERVSRIGTQYHWTDPSGSTANFLSDNEIENLSIARGTLTGAEREIINHHIVATIKMLEALPWPKHLRNVPEYAGGHHERMDGKGYPRGLTRDQMSVQARVMGIADIFEALTACDRPYKSGKTLSESLAILGNFRKGGHIDPDLFDIFIRQKVYLRYAKRFLNASQIDTIDENLIPGYQP